MPDGRWAEFDTIETAYKSARGPKARLTHKLRSTLRVDASYRLSCRMLGGLKNMI